MVGHLSGVGQVVAHIAAVPPSLQKPRRRAGPLLSLLSSAVRLCSAHVHRCELSSTSQSSSPHPSQASSPSAALFGTCWSLSLLVPLCRATAPKYLPSDGTDDADRHVMRARSGLGSDAPVSLGRLQIGLASSPRQCGRHVVPSTRGSHPCSARRAASWPPQHATCSMEHAVNGRTLTCAMGRR